jgi:hypothetical protein
MRFLYLLAVCLLLQFLSFAQVQQSGWVASFNTFGLTPKWSLHFDAQLRSTDAIEKVQTLLLRPGINYHINKQWVASAGYAYIPNRRTIGNLSGMFAEHRLWQQLVYNHKISSVATAHRLRYEQRFLPQVVFDVDDLTKQSVSTAYRLRYFIRNVLPLQKGVFTQGPFLALQNEVFLNTGSKSALNGKTFDQNRLYLAFGYRLPHSKIDLEAGYMNQYIEGRNKAFTNNHVAQIAVYKRL